MKIGDIIYVEQDREDASRYYLRQKPKINGAIAVIAPHTGHVLAMQGGYSFGFSEFNRATQALRQPGSSFKPFIYAAALSMGYSPATLINDSPMSIHIPGQKVWTPVNYDKTFMGNITMRVALEKSRNVPTIRLAQDVGMKKVSQIAKDFGIDEKLAHYYPLALGAGETTLMRMVNAYAMIANGGKAIQPVYITQVQDRYGKVLMKDDMRECKDCNNVDWKNQDFPVPADNRKVVLDEVSTYQLTSMLQGVVQRGTATILKSLNAPIAGKTGTTNDAKDVWFIGFTSDLAVGCYLGYDEPKSLGVKQTGGGLAAPIVKAFLTDALPITRHDPFPVPKNIELVKVNRKNGMPTNGESEDTVTEAFQPGTAPVETQKWYNNVNEPTTPSNDYYMPPKKVDETIMQGTGGLY
jgi:penicillin-binding protein 1A